MEPIVWQYAFGSVIVVSLVSLVGVVTLSIRQEILSGLVFGVVGLAAGALFGDAFIHLVPEAFSGNDNPVLVSITIIAGIFFFFVLEKLLHWRHSHGFHEESLESLREHDHRPKPLGAIVLVSDSIHNIIDGVIIGVGFLAGIPVGIATTLAVVLHEIPQEIGDFGLLLHSGWTRGKALLFNFISALLSIVGVSAALIMGEQAKNLLPLALGFAAGGFIYIAGSDLVPELHRTTDARKSAIQVAFMMIGVSLMLLSTLY